MVDHKLTKAQAAAIYPGLHDGVHASANANTIKSLSRLGLAEPRFVYSHARGVWRAKLTESGLDVRARLAEMAATPSPQPGSAE